MAQIGSVLFGELLSGRALVELDRRSAADAEAPAVSVEPVPQEAELAEAAPAASATDTAVSPAPVTPDPAGDARQRSNLRSWFTRHAKTVGTTLISSEPPIVAPTSVAIPETIAAVEPAISLPEPTVVTPAIATAEPAEALATDEFDDDSDALAEAANAERLANLAADLILGRTRIVLLASLGEHRDSAMLAERLIADVLHRGLSVARVDAGSGRPSVEPGITDLDAEEASFGDVVHKTAEEGLAEVPWGHLASLDRRSTRPGDPDRGAVGYL